MYVRCAGCGETTRVAPAELHDGVTCTSCGRHASLDRAKDLGSTPDERYHRARDFAREKKIDLASAYSILLGILPMAKALPIPTEEHYDKGFNESIDDGFMTVQQAVERRDRVLYASTLAQKHGLSMGLAFLVTDNRMHLADALAQQAGDASPAVEKSQSTRTLWNIVEVGVAVVIVAVAMLMIFRPSPASPELARASAATAPISRAARPDRQGSQQPPSKLPEAVVVKTDLQGRVVEVSGPDPKTVLVGLCAQSEFSRTLTPIALAPAVPPSAGDRMGLLRDMNDLSVARYVAIHRDLRTGRWFTGDGLNPLEIQRADTLPPSTAITPI